MGGISIEQTDRPRHALIPLHGDQLAWRVASVAVSLVSVALIAVTLAYKLRGAEPPSVLLLVLLAAFAIVVLLLSRFLRLAYHEQSLTTGALNATERKPLWLHAHRTDWPHSARTRNLGGSRRSGAHDCPPQEGRAHSKCHYSSAHQVRGDQGYSLFGGSNPV
jgi:hypothetical protein